MPDALFVNSRFANDFRDLFTIFIGTHKTHLSMLRIGIYSIRYTVTQIPVRVCFE